MSSTVSVVVPTYCDAPYILECLQSLLPYTHLIREICISDNASIDNTWDILSNFQAPGLAIRMARHTAHVSAAENWMRALSMAEGDYVLFLSSDDFLRPSGLEDAIEKLDREPTLAGVVLRMQYFVDSTNEVLSELPPPDSIESLNGPVDHAVDWMLSHANQDELIYAVWHREVIGEAMALTNTKGREAVAWWWTLNALLARPQGPRIDVTTDVVLMKRVEKRFSAPARTSQSSRTSGRLGAALLRASNSWRGRRGTLDNLMRLRRRGVIKWPSVQRLLFQTRVNSSTGAAFGGPLSLGTACSSVNQQRELDAPT